MIVMELLEKKIDDVLNSINYYRDNIKGYELKIENSRKEILDLERMLKDLKDEKERICKIIK